MTFRVSLRWRNSKTTANGRKPRKRIERSGAPLRCLIIRGRVLVHRAEEPRSLSISRRLIATLRTATTRRPSATPRRGWPTPSPPPVLQAQAGALLGSRRALAARVAL
jgi:hypothetical protein